MTSLLRVQANRLNALQSTGPRTPAGKAATSANALRHGLRSLKPVLLPGESAAVWKKFAGTILQDLNPRGPVQMMWAGRIAHLMWRLRSSADSRKLLLDQQWREAAVLAPQSLWWRHRRATEKSLPSSPEKIRVALAKSKREQELLFRVAELPGPPGPETAGDVDPQTAVDLIDLATHHLHADDEMADLSNHHNRFPGLGPLAHSPDPEHYPWTLQNVRAGLSEVAAWKSESYAGLLVTMMPAMRKAHRALLATTRRVQREMLNFRLCAAARSPETHEKFDRYETGLQRSLAHATSQLRLLQSQNPDQTSPHPAETSQNVVQLGFVSLETPAKQA